MLFKRFMWPPAGPKSTATVISATCDNNITLNRQAHSIAVL